MSCKSLSVILHTVEALVALFVALFIASRFPEYQVQAFVIIFGVLSFLAKGARTSDSVPVSDYVNDPISKSGK